MGNILMLTKEDIKKSLIVFFLLIATAVAAILATPKFNAIIKAPLLEDVVPLKIADWTNKPSPYAQVSVNADAKNLTDLIYDQVLMRTYEDADGNQVMLALGYAGEQRQEIKIHQPEVCYPAQGYQIVSLDPYTFRLADYGLPIQGKHIVFSNKNRLEAVSYWIRLGNSFPMTGMEMRLKILKEGLKGNLDDGVLVRVSSIIADSSEAAAAYQLHERFLNNLVTSVNQTAPSLLVPANK